jgi:hypothetical protein
MNLRPAPFPFLPRFQNGPRRPGCAPENLFNNGKDFPPPRTNRAPLTAPGRSEDFQREGKGGNCKGKAIRSLRLCPASRWSALSCSENLE